MSGVPRQEFGRVHIDLKDGVHTPGCCVDKSCGPDTCMRLPTPATCQSCAHLAKCVTLFGAALDSQMCEFYPRRYRASS